MHTVDTVWRAFRRLAAIALCILIWSPCPAEDTGSVVRPPGVPAEAIRVGGKDGGVFVQLSKERAGPSNLYRAAVFEETRGTPLFVGLLKLLPEGSPPIDVRNRAEFLGWDGEELLLVDGRKLVKVRLRPRNQSREQKAR